MNVAKFMTEHFPKFSHKEQQELNDFLKADEEEPFVFIEQLDETGELLWVIRFIGWDSFWIEGFKTLPEALNFCQLYELNIK